MNASTTPPSAPEDALIAQPDVAGALAFQAPFLIEKLVRDRIARDAEEAEQLFLEVKRFLVLVRSDPDRVWDMYSRRVDEAWHQLVLFTREYIEFGFDHFGSYLQHRPGGLSDESLPPLPATSTDASPTCFHDFKAYYEDFFGMALPSVWDDAESVNVNRRVIHDTAGELRVEVSSFEARLIDPSGKVLIAVSGPAVAALEFLSSTDAFYVRELPGLETGEQVALAQALVRQGVLRVAP